jgi:hypothetical protein
MLTSHELRTRVLAIMTAVADGRHTDVDPLIADLDPEDVGTLVSGLASLAVNSLIPPHLRRDPAALARAAEVIRADLLDRALSDDEDDHGGTDA